MESNNLQIYPEVIWVRPLPTAPMYVNLRKVYRVKVKNIKPDKTGRVHIYVEELKKWMLYQYFRIDFFIYN